VARIVFGAATSRSPLVAAGPELWGLLGDRDRERGRFRDGSGAVVTYDELLAKAPAGIEAELTPETFRAKHAAAMAAMDRAVERLTASRPDVVLIMGDDEEEYIHDELRPAIALYRGERWRNVPRATRPGDPIGEATNWQWGREERDYPVAAELTSWTLDRLIEAEFDVADSLTLEAMAHGFGFVYERLLGGAEVPMLPVIVNVHTPPAQPTPKRCYDLGRALRQAVESWHEDLRVAVVATGGLSVGVVEEELDRRVLDALQRRDVDTIAGLPRRWMQGSTGEVLCWVCAGGALEHLSMEVLEYIPAYRSPAATGAGLAFAIWQ
jgi:hypothetical protein